MPDVKGPAVAQYDPVRAERELRDEKFHFDGANLPHWTGDIRGCLAAKGKTKERAPEDVKKLRPKWERRKSALFRAARHGEEKATDGDFDDSSSDEDESKKMTVEMILEVFIGIILFMRSASNCIVARGT